jgi:hypothetical protein
METFLGAILGVGGFACLMCWGRIQDRKEHPGHTLRADIEGIVASWRRATVTNILAGAWKLAVYLIGLTLFFTAAALVGFTGPMCWRC